MEKQRDKAARRMQRKAERQAGMTSEEPEEFGAPEASEGSEDTHPQTGDE